jgi:hypothetical protein
MKAVVAIVATLFTLHLTFATSLQPLKVGERYSGILNLKEANSIHFALEPLKKNTQYELRVSKCSALVCLCLSIFKK